jgi:ketosteroid isomerase-like protein
MQSWLAKRLVSHNMARLRQGDIGPTARMYARDVRFRFPGDSSWAGEIQGKEGLEAWLRRFAAAGLQIFPDEVVLKGFPWQQSVCVRGHIHLDSADGRRVYENRYVIWGHMSWGKMREYEVYEDTLQTGPLDDYLATLEPGAAAGEAAAG